MADEVIINNNILTWAVARAGYGMDEFAKVKNFPKILDWIDEKKKPTIKQLEDFSNKVHLPFGYLFLAEPPVENLLFPFFRTGNQTTTKVSINVYDTILLLQKRQEWLTDYLQEADFEPLNFVGKYNAQSDALSIVTDIRKTLNLEQDWAARFSTWEDAKKHLSEKIEESGIAISFNSVVGNNNYRPINVEECRGFVLVDKYAPFMFINAADSKAAQMFTLVHELAHIFIGQSAGFDFKELLPSDDPIEKLCDSVAAEFLVPANLFERYWQQSQDFTSIARRFKVSPIVAARRALDLGKITKNEFFQFYHTYLSSFPSKKDKQNTGGGDFYATQKVRLSLRFMGHLAQALKEGKIPYRDAYKLSGLTGETLQNFIKKTL